MNLIPEENCKIASIIVAAEGSDVTQYTEKDSQLLNSAEKAYGPILVKKGLELMKAIPDSDYDTKLLCIRGDKITALVPMTYWSARNRKTMLGSLTKFPAKTTQGEPNIKISRKTTSEWVQGNSNSGIAKVSGYVGGKLADICLMEVKPVLE